MTPSQWPPHLTGTRSAVRGAVGSSRYDRPSWLGRGGTPLLAGTAGRACRQTTTPSSWPSSTHHGSINPCDGRQARIDACDGTRATARVRGDDASAVRDHAADAPCGRWMAASASHLSAHLRTCQTAARTARRSALVRWRGVAPSPAPPSPRTRSRRRSSRAARS